jgi:signal peptidase I
MHDNSNPSQPVTLQEKSGSGWTEFLSTLSILGIALLTALFIIGFVFRSYQVDGPSMERTLQNGDKLIIWKVPRSWARVTNNDYIPKRGDIVVFDQAGLSEFGQRDSKQLIKRVIGLPGERVVVNNGTVTIYNKENVGGFNPDANIIWGENITATSGSDDRTLSEDELFVMGDNRPDSLDSRSFGPIKAEQVVGKLMLRVFPINNAKVY